MTQSWIKKYEPSTILDIKGQDLAIKQIDEFILNHKTQKKKAMIIYGPSGCGKTSTVSTMAKQYNLEVVEVNASDFRNKDQIESKIGNAIKQQSLFYKSKIILIDEINGLSGRKDRGGVSAIAKLIASSKFPIIMTSDDPWDRKFSPLRSKSNLIEFKQLSFEDTHSVLKSICEKESLTYEEKALRTLARSAGGDLRAAINDLQSFSTKKHFTVKDLESLPERNKVESMQNALTKIFKTTEAKLALSAFDNVSEDLQKSMLWLDQNLPQEYSSKDLAEAYDKLSKADVYFGRIRRRQHWRFLVYINTLLTAGVAMAKTQKNKKIIPYKQTSRILRLWQANMKYHKRKAIAEKIALKTHCSTRTALQNSLPYFKTIFENNSNQALILSEYLDLNDDEINWLQS